GNIGHAQDLENCILAMEEVGKKYGYKLLIVGDGDKRTDLEELTRSRDLQEYVEFKGPVPREEVPTLISESVVGLAPLKNLESLDYAVPSKIYEYMACEIPFLGCGTGEIETLAKKSEAGVVADNHPDSIAEAMIELMKKWEKMGKNGSKHVKNCYRREEIVKDLKSVLDNM
ncbi:MAG: glycosyltransferase, partial [Methanobacterium paludis]|nr:glycosyltransferase [Methanobacterium paludis]